ncbi:piggyBac transposable element-derived protein 4-like [Centruroides sculpturatus]|uniref:piggyBac transposable element-derived protein 4-like n=1 Tax=Centruroides sculpturatus TaxID=218467 RepID=UPI000C6D1087|nr:piggyBac transposable element-derived protein 4-like [Centruroides sculpturatus]XP_023228764.1 piggyBac transposable element-derived protein 4-like [Centruroides sculpturatus]
MSDSEFECSNLSESESDESFTSGSDLESSDSFDGNIDSSKKWYRINAENPPAAPPRFPFLATPGCSFTLNDVLDPLEYFRLFFDINLVNIIVKETNRYAMQQPKASRKHWDSVITEDIYVFLTICIIQGIIHKPDEKMYWTRNEIFLTPIFSKLMPRNRFLQIKKNLHFSNNGSYRRTTHPNSKINNIWPIVANLNKKCSHLYVPERDISVDESLMLYKGRISWKQDIPLKRSRFDVKFFMLCESASGYLYNFIIYTGKGTSFNEKYQEMPIASKIVLSLADPLLGKGYCLTTDNYYTSPQLADYLISCQTDLCGTVRTNRKGVPGVIRNKNMEKGEIVAMRRDKVMILKWQDKSAVALLSTIHNPVKVYKEMRDGSVQSKPQVVLDYNHTMRGVDRLHQHLHDYSVMRKRGKKWYKKIFFHLVDICLYNAFVLYKKNGGEKDNLGFRMKLVERLIEEYHTGTRVKKQGRSRESSLPSRLTERHYPDFIPPTEKKTSPTRCCVVCCNRRNEEGKKVRKETRYYCEDCGVALCIVPCFEIYHTKENY